MSEVHHQSSKAVRVAPPYHESGRKDKQGKRLIDSDDERS